MLKQLIVLDDEEGFKFLFEHHLDDLIQSGTFKLDFCTNTAQATKALEKKYDYKVLLCDLVLPGENGLTFAQKTKINFPETKILIMSGHNPNCDEFPYFPKPIDFIALRKELLVPHS